MFFFWRISGTVVVVGVPDFFFASGWIEIVVLKKQHYECAWIAKSVTEKNNSRVDCAEAGKKTVQAPLRQAQRTGEKG